MKEVCAYQANDGKVFATQKECEEYEKISEARVMLYDLFNECEISFGDSVEDIEDAFIETLLENYDQMSQIFVDAEAKKRIEYLHEQSIRCEKERNVYGQIIDDIEAFLKTCDIDEKIKSGIENIIR